MGRAAIGRDGSSRSSAAAAAVSAADTTAAAVAAAGGLGGGADDVGLRGGGEALHLVGSFVGGGGIAVPKTITLHPYVRKYLAVRVVTDKGKTCVRTQGVLR